MTTYVTRDCICCSAPVEWPVARTGPWGNPDRNTPRCDWCRRRCISRSPARYIHTPRLGDEGVGAATRSPAAASGAFVPAPLDFPAQHEGRAGGQAVTIASAVGLPGSPSAPERDPRPAQRSVRAGRGPTSLPLGSPGASPPAALAVGAPALAIGAGVAAIALLSAGDPSGVQLNPIEELIAAVPIVWRMAAGLIVGAAALVGVAVTQRDTRGR